MNPISGLIAYALIAALVGAAAFGAIQTGRLWHAQTKTAEAQTALLSEQKERAELEADRERIARKFVAERETREVTHAASTQKLVEKYQRDSVEREATIAAMQRGAEQLQQRIEEYTLARRPGGDEASAAQCSYYRNRLAATGKLLDRTYRFAARITGEAEKRTDQARLLQQQLLADRAACK